MSRVPKTKHTPGPWVVDSNHDDACFVGQDNGIAVASMLSEKCDMAANARLISAAPEMLEALELAQSALLEFVGTKEQSDLTQAAFYRVIEAIAKSRGES